MNLIWFTLPGWIVTAVVVALHLGVMGYILYTKHQDPGEAMLWLLVVALLPLVGIALFLFFGITRIRQVQDKVLNVHSRLDGEEARILGEEIVGQRRRLQCFVTPPGLAESPHDRMLDRLFPERPAIVGNRVEMLQEGIQAYPRMLEDMLRAKKCIRLQSFIFMSDEVGRKFLDTLERKAAEGVDVKVLYDSFGSFKSYFSRFFWRCIRRRTPHFQIHAFSPVNLLAPWKFQLRNHRKLLVIDGMIAYTGGINIAAENTRLPSIPPKRYIHDLHCRITGPAVAQLAMSFFRDWAYTTRRHLRECAVPGDFPDLTAAGDTTLRIIDSGPGENYLGTRNLFCVAATMAQKSLEIMTPYMVPGPEFVGLLGLAAARGVEVKIIVPRHNNHKFVDWAARSFYRELLRSGVRIFERRGLFSHTKALLVDETWGFMGSSNCDSRSFRLNFELDFCFEGEFSDRVARQFRNELSVSDAVRLEHVEACPLPRQMLENACSLLTPIL